MTADPASHHDIRDRASYKWLVVAMLWLVCFLNYADRLAIFSVFPLLKDQLQLSDVQLGVAGASFMWVYALCGPFAGWLSDRVPKHRLVLLALLFWSLITAATALCHSYAELVVCRALGGLGEAFYFPAAMSLISEYHTSATRSRAMSLHQSSVYAGSIAGGTISGLVAQHYGWRFSFVLFGGAGIALALLLWKFLQEPRVALSPGVLAVTETTRTASIRDVLSNRMVLLLISVFIGANFVAVVFLTWLPTFLFRKFHMSLALAGLNATAFLQIASVLGVLSGGVLADTMVKKSPRGRMVTQAIGLLCGVPFLFLTGWTTAVPVLVVAMIGFGYFKGLYDANIFAALYDVVPESRRGVAAGVLNSMGWLGGGFAPVIIAVAAEKYGMGTCLSATAAIYLLLGIVLLVGSSRFGPRPPQRDLHST